jgi:hypothetical protein
MSKLFPSPRIPTEKIPECRPFLATGEDTKLYRFSPTDYHELAAVWNGNHPRTASRSWSRTCRRTGFPPNDLPAQTGGHDAGLEPGRDRRDLPAPARGRRPAVEGDGEVTPVPDGMFKGLVAKVTPGG